jgi:hypothetical protein
MGFWRNRVEWTIREFLHSTAMAVEILMGTPQNQVFSLFLQNCISPFVKKFLFLRFFFHLTFLGFFVLLNRTSEFLRFEVSCRAMTNFFVVAMNPMVSRRKLPQHAVKEHSLLVQAAELLLFPLTVPEVLLDRVQAMVVVPSSNGDDNNNNYHKKN